MLNPDPKGLAVIGAFILTPLGEILIAATERFGINAPGVKALFFGLMLMLWHVHKQLQ